MKNRNIINKTFGWLAIASLTFAMIGCEKEYVPVDTVNDVVYTTSISPGTTDTLELNVGGYISMMDASQGILTHKWIIEDGYQFMIDDFASESNEDYSLQVDPNKGLESENLVESVYFGKVGMTTITLRDTFSEWVTSHDEYPVEAYEENGVWVFEKVLQVDVFDEVQAAFNVYVDDECVLSVAGTQETNLNNPTQIEVTVGKAISFVDMSNYDRPDARYWSVPESAEVSSSDSLATFSFNNIGTYSGFAFTARRTTPSYSSTKDIPLIISVVPSSDPFEASAVSIETSDATSIVISANGAFSSAGSDAASAFSVAVSDMYGEPLPQFSVASVSVNASNSAQLLVTLSEQVYPGESVTLTYDGTAGITSTDTRELESFTEVEVVNNNAGDNYLAAYEVEMGFEGGTDDTFTTLGWSVSTALANGYISLAPRPGDTATDGNAQCVYIDVYDSSVPAPIYFQSDTSNSKTFPVVAGNYLYQFSVYLVEDSLVGKHHVMWAYYTSAFTQVSDNTTQLFPAEAVGAWHQYSIPVTIDKDVNYGIKFQLPPGNTTYGVTKLYVDDFKLVIARP
ncbi:MAG: hypothetical protein SNI32_05685 [Rikenellaceae bacterium]